MVKYKSFSHLAIYIFAFLITSLRVRLSREAIQSQIKNDTINKIGLPWHRLLAKTGLPHLWLAMTKLISAIILGMTYMEVLYG